MRRRRPISVARAPEAKAANTTQVIRFIAAIIETVVGEDENPSPLLKSLIADLNVDENDVEIAQDITLPAIDIMEKVATAVDSGSAASLPFELISVIAPAVPEIQMDINRLK